MKFRGKVKTLGTNEWRKDVLEIEIPSNLFVPEGEYDVTLEKVRHIEFEGNLSSGPLRFIAVPKGVDAGRYKVTLEPIKYNLDESWR